VPQIAELKSKAETFEKEKDFYFSKLRDIELLCQSTTIQDIPVGHRVCRLCLGAVTAGI
jgi:microtubule-associated protein, RP/EB family